MFRQPFTRGTSVLAALVFVAILGVVAYGVGAVSPNQKNIRQTAQVNASLITNKSVPTAASSKDAKIELTGAARCNSPMEKKKAKVSTPAVEGGVNNICVPGCEFTVQKDTGSVEAKDVCENMPTGNSAQVQAKKTCETTRKCIVKVCSEPGKCDSSLSGSRAENTLGKVAQIPEYFKSEQEVLDALKMARAGKEPTSEFNKLPSWYQEAFKEVKYDEQTKVDEAIVKNKQDQELKLKELENATSYGNNDRVVERIQADQDALKRQEEQLKAQASNLANVKAIGESKVELGPVVPGSEPGNKTGTGDCPGNPGCPGNPTGFNVPVPIPQPDPRKEAQTGGNTGAGGNPENPAGGGGGLGGALQSILGGLMKALGGAGGAGAGAACPSDPNAYAQQQQQYNQQLQQYNLQLQQYNYQQQMSQYNDLPGPVPPQPPSQCTQTPSSNTCANPPAQPAASGCGNGTWKPVTTQQSNGASCTTSWQCVPGGSGVTPVAQLSCQPQVADVGMSVAITYGCTNATESAGSGFDTAKATSGSTTTVIAAPPDGKTSVNYAIQCRNQGLVGNASCSVQIARPSIVLLANPKIVPVNSISTIGWVTASMQSCVVSSPDMPEFTVHNASSTVVNGMATTSPITANVRILLHCVTLGGATKDATTTVQVATSTTP